MDVFARGWCEAVAAAAADAALAGFIAKLKRCWRKLC